MDRNFNLDVHFDSDTPLQVDDHNDFTDNKPDHLPVRRRSSHAVFHQLHRLDLKSVRSSWSLQISVQANFKSWSHSLWSISHPWHSQQLDQSSNERCRAERQVY